MENHRKHIRIASWLAFVISMIVYWFSVERVGSLWDVGEFILGAHKLQVVHPPGAPLFLVIGRLFAWVGDLVSDDPSVIGWAVNLLSAVCSAFAAFFVASSTGILGKLALVGRDQEASFGESIALGMAALVAGLSTAFATSIWFSAVEGEVYAMSTMFTAMTFWAMVRWYSLPDTAKADRWIVFAVFATGLSVGVHLLSLLTFPALAMFYFYKKYPQGNSSATVIGAVTALTIAFFSAIVALFAIGESSFSLLFFGLAAAGFAYLGIAGFKSSAPLNVVRILGGLTAALGGTIVLTLTQAVIIKGLPALWARLEVIMVNGLGLPFHSGLIPVLLIVGGLIYFLFWQARNTNNRGLELIAMSAMMLVIGFSVVGVVMIRANASPPVNMNAPTDAMRLQYYLNREQYGDRPLVYGPHFDARPIRYDSEERYGRLGDRYEVVDEALEPIYRPGDKLLFPRMADPTQGRPNIYRNYWMNGKQGPITMGDNLNFFVRYQLDWMYWRYFMWNFSGRQNHEQGFYDNDPRSGNWITGFDFIDEMILGIELDELPESQRNDPGRNTYYALPFLFGLLGLVFHLRKKPEDFLAVLALFVITGIGIIIYTNQPPNEPRERDYVQAGAVFIYCVWIGMGVLGLYELLRRFLSDSIVPSAIAGLVVLSAPALMALEGFDDHSRMTHQASRDYAANFLNSLAPNAIIFTYGDNDTYPLWYAQEVENIRPDVRVVNLSLIAVDWYIDLLRRKVNESEPVKLTIPSEKLRGYLRNQVPIMPQSSGPMSVQQVLQFVSEDHPVVGGGREFETSFPTTQVFIPVTQEAARASGTISDLPDSARISRVDFDLGGAGSVLKDDLAVMDVIGSNVWERPIYFAVTVPEQKMLGLRDYFRLEGLALRLTPFRSQSDPSFGPMGAGRVDLDQVYTNFTEKFAYGNFNTHPTFVDPSYMPSIQAMQFVMVRTIAAMQAAGQKDRALEMSKLYFNSFPNYNFPFSYNSLYPIQSLIRGGDEEAAKEHLRTLTISMRDWMEFYESQDPAKLIGNSPLAGDMNQVSSTIGAIMTAGRQLGDEAFSQEIRDLLGPYAESALPPPPSS